MKKIKWIFILTLALAATFSCTDLDNLNSNPTKSTSFNPNLMIPTIQQAFSYGHQDSHRYLTYPGGFMNQWIGDWGVIEYGGKAQINLSFMERLWIIFYPDVIKNVTSLVTMTEGNDSYVNQNAIGRILRVESFLRLTDYYGDIPYFEAGKVYEDKILKPKYDKQEDIYMDFLKELRECSAQLSSSAPAVTHDLYFGGDVNKWKRFANSLWLRIAMRLVKVNPEKAKQEAKAAYDAGVMQSNDDICFVKHEESTQDVGPGNGFANRLLADPTASAFRMTDEMLEALTSTNDPRFPFIGRCYFNDGKRTDITELVYDKLGKYLGVPAQEFIYGGGAGSGTVWEPAITAEVDGKEVSITHHYQRLQPSKLLTAAGSPFIHLPYAETEFLLAEAALRGWSISGETAEAHYKKGLQAAVKQWSIFGATLPGDDEITAWVNQQVLGTGTAGLEEIAKQLWILYILDPFETWCTVRRTEGMPTKYTKFYNRYPNVNNSNGKMPRRMLYPLEEQIKNKQNYDEALSRIPGNTEGERWIQRMWWDVEVK